MPSLLRGYLPEAMVNALTDYSIEDLVRAAYQMGYNDHARTVQHWQDTHGAYRAAPDDREHRLLPALTAVRLANCGFPDDLSQHTQCDCREAALRAIFAVIDGGES
jgi:hypothetical protein